MWRNPACAAAGLAMALAAAYTLTPTISAAFTQAASVKGDRLPVTAKTPAAGGFAFSFNLPEQNTTIVAKNPPPPRVVTSVSFPRKRPAEAVQPPMDKPAVAQKPKLPEGCEPSFSPVTVPAMAHVAGRCTS
jgi:hypothetical protein